MKNSKILAEAYTKSIYKEGYDDLMYAPDILQSKIDFIAGFNSAKNLKWNSVNNKLPKSDHYCLCWVRDDINLCWSTFETGHYENKNWYLNGSRNSNEVVTHWIKIEKPS